MSFLILLGKRQIVCCFLRIIFLFYFTITGWPADLEFLETWKSQGILWHLKNAREKSGNFNTTLGKVGEFYLWKTNIAEVFSKLILVMNKNQSCLFIYKACSWISKNKNKFTLFNNPFFDLNSALFIYFIFLKSFYFVKQCIITCSFYIHFILNYLFL